MILVHNTYSGYAKKRVSPCIIFTISPLILSRSLPRVLSQITKAGVNYTIL